MSPSELEVVPVGTGSRCRMVVPGIGIGTIPSEWAELAHALAETLLIIRNPFHRNSGKHWKECEEYPGKWQGWWRDQLLRTLQAFQCPDTIAISRGALDLLKIQIQLRLRSITLLSPATADPMKPAPNNVPEIDEELDLDTYRMHETLRYLCPGMDRNAYRTFLMRQVEQYGQRFKDIMRCESPQKTGVALEFSKKLVEDIPAATLLTVIAGEWDRWYDEERTLQILKGRTQPKHVKAGHPLHVQCPKEVAGYIKQ